MAKSTKTKRPRLTPRYTDAELLDFVRGYCDGRVFTSLDMGPQLGTLAHVVFLPLAFGGPGGIGEDCVLLWEWRHEAIGGRAINGFPIFASVRTMGAPDWDRARVAIKAELKRRESVALPPPVAKRRKKG